MIKLLSTTALAGVLALGLPQIAGATTGSQQSTGGQPSTVQQGGTQGAGSQLQGQGTSAMGGQTGAASATPAATGAQMGRMSDDEVRNMLRGRGYSDVSDIRREGDTIRAKAKQNDREVNLRIDTRSGEVTRAN